MNRIAGMRRLSDGVSCLGVPSRGDSWGGCRFLSVAVRTRCIIQRRELAAMGRWWIRPGPVLGGTVGHRDIQNSATPGKE